MLFVLVYVFDAISPGFWLQTDAVFFYFPK
jgi:hypothetical protein